jgi:kynurenine formamidase
MLNGDSQKGCYAMGLPENFPTFAELPIDPALPPGSGWQVFGPDDEIGTLNHLTPERVKAASALVRTGESFGLYLPVDQFAPGIAHRTGLTHNMLHVGWRGHEPNFGDDFSAIEVNGRKFYDRDDYLDRFWLQGSSQWDGVGHFVHPVHGDYNGVAGADVHAGLNSKIGVDKWCARGIVGRGVLLDLARSFERSGRDFDVASPFAFTTDDLERAADEQGTELRPGDILILRTGWIRQYLGAAATDPIRAGIVCAGLEPSDKMAGWLWDHQFAATAADNCGVEAYPSPPGQLDFVLHYTVLPLFGMPWGEFWALEQLADHCAQVGAHDFMFVSAPLNVTGAQGSPAQAIAIV